MGEGSQELLNRARSLKDSAALRSLSTPALAAVTDYGVDIFLRLCAVPLLPGEIDVERFSIVFPYLHLIEMLDGVAVLLEQGAPIPARLPVRSAFESMMTIKYILAEDKQRRALAWLVSDIHRRIYLYEMHDPNTEAGSAYAKARSDDYLIGPNPFLTIDSAPRTAPLKSMLAKTPFAEVDIEFQRLQRKLNRPPNWYSLFGGPKTLKKLADQLKLGGYYGVMYRVWSGTAHAQDLYRQLVPSPAGEFLVRHLRSTSEQAVIATNAISFFMETTAIALKAYVPSDLPAWQKWYVDTLQAPYQGLAKWRAPDST